MNDTTRRHHPQQRQRGHRSGLCADADTAQLMRDLDRPAGSTQARTSEPVKLRLDADLLAALRATGDD